MEISNGMLNHYLEDITFGWFGRNELPPDDINEYHDRVLQIKADAAHHNDLEPLRLGLDYLLCNPRISLEDHGGRYPFTDEEVRDIIRYIRATIYPDATPLNCEEVKDVELVYTSRFEWWDSRAGCEHQKYYDANWQPITKEEWEASKQPYQPKK